MLETLTCPMCRADVPTRAMSCRSCHLPISDVNRHQASIRSPRRRSFQNRLWGLVAYAAIAGWCVVALPSAVTFVVPAAAAAAVLHVLRGRPWVAALVFVAIVVVAPLLLWPSISTDVLDDLGSLL